MGNKPTVLYIYCSYCQGSYEVDRCPKEDLPEYCVYCGNDDIKIDEKNNIKVKFSER